MSYADLYVQKVRVILGSESGSWSVSSCSVPDPGCLSGSRIRLFSIPDPNFFHPGSEFFDPGSAQKNLSILTPKKWCLSSRKYDPGCSSWIWILTFYPSRIPDPGVKKAPDPGSESATLSTCRLSIMNFDLAGNKEDTTTKGPDVG